jgi:hypothetical protein
MRRPIVGALVALGVLLLGGLIVFGVHRQGERAQHRQEIETIGAEWQKTGRMSQADYVQLREITDSVRGATATDEQAGWLATQLHNATSSVARARILGAIQSIHEFSPRQRDMFFTATLPLLQSDSALDRMYGASAQKALRDPRAIPYLVRLLDDPDEKVKKVARRSLNALGSRG